MVFGHAIIILQEDLSEFDWLVRRMYSYVFFCILINMVRIDITEMKQDGLSIEPTQMGIGFLN